jgi:hypothetical protein
MIREIQSKYMQNREKTRDCEV